MNYPAFFDQEIILQDERVRLEPLQEKHFDLLLPVALEKDLWRFTVARIETAEQFRAYFDTALLEKTKYRSYPFAVFDKKEQSYSGSTRFGNIDLKNRRLEIGWTWIHPSLHGCGFNKHCKYLLLNYCFETLQLNRVELKTSHLNLRSQKAMLRIGAVQEGIFRKHTVNDDGTIRDTVYFSFIKDEWPSIKNTYFRDLLSAK